MIAVLALVPRGVWIGLGVAVVAVAGLAVLIHSAERRGADTATTEIRKQNDANQERADRASGPVERCYAGGGRWVRELGTCQ